jgi:hypothetical protein
MPDRQVEVKHSVRSLKQSHVLSSGVAASLRQGLIRMPDTLMFAHQHKHSTSSLEHHASSIQLALSQLLCLHCRQVDSLRTNHRGTFVLKDNQFRCGASGWGCAAGLPAPESCLRAAPVPMFINSMSWRGSNVALHYKGTAVPAAGGRARFQQTQWTAAAPAAAQPALQHRRQPRSTCCCRVQWCGARSR